MNDEKREAAIEREMQAEDASDLFDTPDYIKKAFRAGLERGFDAGLAAASQWKVIETDGLPEAKGYYFITYGWKDDVCEAYFGECFLTCGNFEKITTVKAWMPLPAPFTKGETEE